MRWIFKLIEITSEAVRYAYSTDSDDADGVIVFNRATSAAEIETPSTSDIGSQWAQVRTLRHFEDKMSDVGFIEAFSICCG